MYYYRTMNTMTVQTTNVNVKIKEKADKVAQEAGFNSVQDVIRIFLKDLSEGEIPLKMNWGYTRNPDLNESIRQYKNGQYKELKENEKLSDKIRDDNI